MLKEAREKIPHIQEYPYKAITGFLRIKLDGQESGIVYLKCLKKKKQKLPTKNTFPDKAVLQN